MVGVGMGAVRSCMFSSCPRPGVVDRKPVFPLSPKDSVCVLGGRGGDEEFPWSSFVGKYRIWDVAWAPRTLLWFMGTLRQN